MLTLNGFLYHTLVTRIHIHEILTHACTETLDNLLVSILQSKKQHQKNKQTNKTVPVVTIGSMGIELVVVVGVTVVVVVVVDSGHGPK